MASRYSRDRSPPRPLDRRPSTTYTPGASSYRGTGEPQSYSQERPPPRGPKADFRGGGYQFSPAPRGRGGFPVRTGDTWDRDRERDRDGRTQPPAYRREEDRDWTRREREFPASDRGVGFSRERGYVGRERSERSASPDRPRRNSKENNSSTFSRPSESGSSYYGPAAKGAATRGRGRGDWDRSRGRSSFVSERDREFFPRSRSREEWRDRYDDRSRPSGPDTERNDRFDRREYDRSDDRDVRAREHDVWQRDRSPGRNSTGRPVSPSAMSSISQHGDRYKAEYDTGRKPSLAGPLSARSEGRREAESDYFATRIETPRRDGPLSQAFPTPSVPQSSSLGLDYGDPPSVPATTPLVQEKPASAPTKPQPVKVDPPSAPSAAPTAPAALQPPSGPKADRVGPPPNAPSTPRAATQQFEQWPKSEPAPRSIRPGPTSHTLTPATETAWKPGESPADNRTPTVIAANDRPLPANVPSGPRATTSNFRSRLLSNEQVAPNAPPTAPRQPKANALENRVIPNAPTGPRASTFPAPNAPHNSPPTGPQAGSNRQWVAPDYRPVKPSIMNQMNKPYQPDPRERSSLSGPPRPGGVIYQSQQAKPKITQPLSSESALLTQPARLLGSLADTPSGTQTPADEEMVDSPADIEMSLPASDEEDVEDDDGLDEDYFAASEETHRREMRLLESKKPLPPLYDPNTAALIVKIQLLGMIANGIVPEAYETIKADAESAMELDPALNNGPLSPEHTPEGISRPTLEHPKPRGRPLSQPLINLIPTPPIDELPYLNDAMEECHVFEETEKDDEREATTMLLCESFVQESWEDFDNVESLHAFYKSKYPLWRREVEHAEQRLREVHQPSPAPASPAPSATPSLPPGPERPGGERTRGARNTTDLDMQQAILMSQQSAKEEEERREREAASNALPNYETEAVVPSMLKPIEINLHYFEDTNNMVEHEFALDIYEFVPPEDDFTEEEQAAFIAAYCQNPKKWGKIAHSIPGRTYQDCIAHYYLTKDKANYKEHWRRSQPKRGRRRAANVKPRANNLMSDLALNEEGEGTPVAVTDSGRPRRAAAPTFGDAPESDAASAAPQAKRLKDSGKDADPSQPKTRGRKGTGAGKGRKAKDKVMVDPSGQLLLPARNAEATSQKLERTVNGKDRGGRSSLKAETIPKLEPYGAAPALNSSMPLDIHKINPGDIQPSNAGPIPVQVTSYWSVPEQTKFPELVQYFGRDFGAIANFLKTKSPIMIKNYYVREVNNGKQELEHLANMADERRAKGEPLGPPPTPVQHPKRRYDATPSMAAIPRPVATVVDHHPMTEAETSVPVTKNIIEEFPANSVQRISGEVVAKPRPPRESLHQSPISSHVHPKIEEPSRADRPSLLQKPLQGPPRGMFSDEPAAYSQSMHQKIQGPNQEASPLQRPVQTVDSRSAESRTQQPSPLIDIRRMDYSRGLLSHSQEQPTQPPQVAALPTYQPMSDRILQHQRLASHSRHPSLVTSHASQSNHEQAAAELAALRHAEPHRGMAYNVSAAHSPASVPIQAIVPANMDQHTITRPNTRIPEPARPAKRSNVFSILNNDEDNEPPMKRMPLENIKRSDLGTPPPQQPAQASVGLSRHHEDSVRSSQTSYGHMGRIDSTRQDYRSDYSINPGPGHQSEAWLAKFDPRQGQRNEQRPAQQPPTSGPYSMVPPSSQANPAPSMTGRFDPTRNIEPSNHRRQLIGIDHAPSPPPQQPQSVNPHRSLSGSSQHGRGLSNSYQQTSTSGPPSYPHSSSSTPVPAMQHRSQHSIDQPRPQTIQQLMREREREQMHAQQRREIDPIQQQPPSQPQLSQQPPSQPPSRMADRYGSAPEPRSTHHVPPPPPSSQTPQPQPLGMPYSTAPPQPSRTYTPPHPSYGVSGGIGGPSHGHHTHQQQYQTHQSQYSHATSNQHHQAYSTHPGYGPPPPQSSQHQRGSVHSLGGAPQSQQNLYRGYGAEERR